MIRAYDESYLNKAQIALGLMMQFAVYDLGYEPDDFFSRFALSEIGIGFEKGMPKYTVGMSGYELAYEVIRATEESAGIKEPSYRMSRSPEYWAGWALAYYSWYNNISFKRISDVIPFSEVVTMYAPLHEADIMKAVVELDGMMKEREKSGLARLRAYADLTQKALAEKANVSVRMIEQYEQGTKDINKASADTVFRLSRALNCSMEDLRKF